MFSRSALRVQAGAAKLRFRIAVQPARSPVSRAAAFSSSTVVRSSSSPPSAPRFRVKNGHIFGALTLLALGATSFGLYDFYSSFNTYPSPIRAHLRAALRLATSDPVRASSEFAKAYDLSLSLHMGLRETTGIAIRWGGLWESAGNLGAAREAYGLALDAIKSAMNEGRAAQEDVKRGAAVALKVGDLWVQDRRDGDAEALYEWGLQELMRSGMTDGQKKKVEMIVGGQEVKKGEVGDDGADEPAAGWLRDVQVVGAMERLGQLYARAGNLEYAQPLLLQAISTLLPPPAKSGPQPPKPSVDDQCHAATLMNNLSSTFVPVSGKKPSKAALDSASRWARQALKVANECKDLENVECQQTAVVASFNLGKLSELAGDETSARNWFIKSGRQANQLGFVEGVRESRLALQRLGTTKPVA